MCGIVGLLSQRPEADRVAHAMAAALVHRGPDGEGFWSGDGVALGHRRLAVIDLTECGAQPMVSADGRIVLTYNGEIYNYLAIRKALEAEGRGPWRGHSDTEILVEGIAHWGFEALLERLEGQFAIAAWDRRERRLDLARDRFGEKPLYWGLVGGDLVFASELKAIRRHPAFDATLDREALAGYLRYAYVPHPRSIYRDVAKLAPGARLSVRHDDLKARRFEPIAYWSVSEAAAGALDRPFAGSEAEAVEALEVLLGETVGSRMVSDVPLGALLSGGIDSSVITALMQAGSSRPVKTFTIGNWDARIDEAGAARSMAERLGTEHTEIYVGPEEALAVVPKLPAIYDEPFADSSQIPTYLVSALARQSVTVALSGDGGDELFGGYNRHIYGGAMATAIGAVPGFARRGLAGLAGLLSPDLWSGAAEGLGRAGPRELAHGRTAERVQKLLRVLSAADRDDLYRRLVEVGPGAGLFSEPDARGLVMPGGVALPARALAFMDRAMLLDAAWYLPDDILTKVDRASMAVSLETRAPFLDRRLFDFAWRLPAGFKVRKGRGKLPLRQLLTRYAPSETFDRPKQGFSVPLADWLRGELKPWAEALIDPGRLKDEGLFDAAKVQRLWAEHQSERVSRDTALWTILMFQAWRSEALA